MNNADLMNQFNLIPQRVKNGISFLSEKLPKFHLLVKRNMLDEGDCFKCVVGQVFGKDYYKAIKVFEIDRAKEISFGFNFAPGMAGKKNEEIRLKYFKHLTKEWRIQLRKLTRSL